MASLDFAEGGFNLFNTILFDVLLNVSFIFLFNVYHLSQRINQSAIKIFKNKINK